MTNKQKIAIEKYKKGHVLINYSRGNKVVLAFKFLGAMYINKNVKRNTKYSFDDVGWSAKGKRFLQRFNLMRTGEFKRVHDCKKSKKVGV